MYFLAFLVEFEIQRVLAKPNQPHSNIDCYVFVYIYIKGFVPLTNFNVYIETYAPFDMYVYPSNDVFLDNGK